MAFKQGKAVCGHIVLVMAVCFWGWTGLSQGQEKQAQEEFEIVLGTNSQQDFPHLMGNSEQIEQQDPGIAIELLQIVAQRADLTFRFERMPWKRCFKALQDGQIQGLFFASYDPTREEYGVFPKQNGIIDERKSYGDAPYYFYKLKSSPVTWDGTKIQNLEGKIGVSRGYSIVPHLRNLGFDVEESTSPMADFSKLILGRVGLAAAIEHNGDHLLETQAEFKKYIEKLALPIVDQSYYLLFSHQFYAAHSELAQKIWDILQEVRTGEYDRLLMKYTKLSPKSTNP
ncbi:transporter substrate-binding domain-containing protein [bacterium]|nr:transporter substrate-binding domain-containing protein [bacterium]